MIAANASGSRLEVPVAQARPHINVTPLIDVLLVLLIIFMVVSPLRPARFLAKMPSEPDRRRNIPADPITLLVTIKSDRSLMLNGVNNVGTVSDTSKLNTMLVELFQQRKQNHDYRYELRDRSDLPDDVRVQKTVFIKAPRSIPY